MQHYGSLSTGLFIFICMYICVYTYIYMSVSFLADKFFLRDQIFLSYCVDEREVTESVFSLNNFKKFCLFIFLAVLGLCCHVWVFSSCSEQGLF